MMPRLISILVMLAGWPLAVASVEVARTVGADMIGSLAWAHAIVAVLIASWSGFAATLGRWLAAKKAKLDFHWSSEALRDAFVSGTIGAGGYWAGSAEGYTSMQIGFALLLAGYAGVSALDYVLDRAGMPRKSPERDG